MRIIRVERPRQLIEIGYAGENDATKIIFPLTKFRKEFGDGRAELTYRYPGAGHEAYPVLSVHEGADIAWYVKAKDTKIAGDSTVQLIYMVGDTVAKSVAYKTKCYDSNASTDTKTDMPWATRVFKASADARQSADEAEASAVRAERAVNGFDKAVKTATEGITVEGTKQTKLVTDKGTEQTNLVTNKGSEEVVKVTSEGNAQVKRVQEEAQGIVADREQINANKKDILLLKQGGNQHAVRYVPQYLEENEKRQARKNIDVPQRLPLQPNTEFLGRTAAFFGDSLTEQNSKYTKGYHSWFQEIVGLSSYKNYGHSGNTILDVIDSIQKSTGKYDIVFIMCGINDQMQNCPLGKNGDMGSDTIYGRYYQLCDLLKKIYETEIVILITPHYMNSIVGSYKVAKAAREMCEMFSIPYYDNFVWSGFRSTQRSAFNFDDVHWNDKGHEKVGKNLARWFISNFGYCYSPKTAQSISATYKAEGVKVTPQTPINNLKPYISVFINYDDGTSDTVEDYFLSGKLEVGTSVLTVIYKGFDTTINVGVVPSVDVKLERISAIYSQGIVPIYPKTPLDNLKNNLIVTAYYENGQAATILDYFLSGKLEVGTSVLTVTYKSLSATFEVLVSENPAPKYTRITNINPTVGFTFLTMWTESKNFPNAETHTVVTKYIFKGDYVSSQKFYGGYETNSFWTNRINSLLQPICVGNLTTVINLDEDGNTVVELTSIVKKNSDYKYFMQCFRIQNLNGQENFDAIEISVTLDGVKIPYTIGGGEDEQKFEVKEVF